MKRHYTLHRKNPTANFSARFCFEGEVRWVSTGSDNYSQADKEAIAMQPEILGELARQAALKGTNPGSNHSDQNFSAAGWASITPNVPPLDLSVSSLRTVVRYEPPRSSIGDISVASGLTIDDALLLRWEDVDFVENVAQVRREKTGSVVTFVMSRCLRLWLCRRRKEAPAGTPYVFWEYWLTQQ